MKIDFSRELLALDGTNLLYDPERLATLKLLAVHALTVAPPPGPRGVPEPLSQVESFTRFCFAREIFSTTGPLEVTSEQITLLKDLIAANFPQPLFAGQAIEMLEAGPEASSPAKPKR